MRLSPREINEVLGVLDYALMYPSRIQRIVVPPSKRHDDRLVTLDFLLRGLRSTSQVAFGEANVSICSKNAHEVRGYTADRLIIVDASWYSEEAWERTFQPMVRRSDDGEIVNWWTIDGEERQAEQKSEQPAYLVPEPGKVTWEIQESRDANEWGRVLFHDPDDAAFSPYYQSIPKMDGEDVATYLTGLYQISVPKPDVVWIDAFPALAERLRDRGLPAQSVVRKSVLFPAERKESRS